MNEITIKATRRGCVVTSPDLVTTIPYGATLARTGPADATVLMTYTDAPGNVRSESLALADSDQAYQLLQQYGHLARGERGSRAPRRGQRRWLVRGIATVCVMAAVAVVTLSLLPGGGAPARPAHGHAYAAHPQHDGLPGSFRVQSQGSGHPSGA